MDFTQNTPMLRRFRWQKQREGFPNTKSQELQCYVNEYRHQNIELTEKVLQDIINHINDKYPNLKWE